jgi:hypothetical protein
LGFAGVFFDAAGFLAAGFALAVFFGAPLFAPKASPGGGRERGFAGFGFGFVVLSILNDSKGIVLGGGMVVVAEMSYGDWFRVTRDEYSFECQLLVFQWLMILWK